MDTGLGREGYSIIGQGKIDEILSAKSAERREVFEEAAGISSYRHRKEEAERKLRADGGESAAHWGQDRRAGAAGGAPPCPGGDCPDLPALSRRAADFGAVPVAGAAGRAAEHQAKAAVRHRAHYPAAWVSGGCSGTALRPSGERWGSRCASGNWLWKPCGKRQRR